MDGLLSTATDDPVCLPVCHPAFCAKTAERIQIQIPFGAETFVDPGHVVLNAGLNRLTANRRKSQVNMQCMLVKRSSNFTP